MDKQFKGTVIMHIQHKLNLNYINHHLQLAPISGGISLPKIVHPNLYYLMNFSFLFNNTFPTNLLSLVHLSIQTACLKAWAYNISLIYIMLMLSNPVLNYTVKPYLPAGQLTIFKYSNTNYCSMQVNTNVESLKIPLVLSHLS